MTNDYNALKSAYTAQNSYGEQSKLQGYMTSTVGDYTSNQLGYQGYTYGTYPAYVDRTQKAFAIAKWLMDSKLIKVASVPEFITLIDGLAGRV